MEYKENLDPNEVHNFDQQAQTWWDEKGYSSPLHHLNPARLQFITNHALIQHKKILDVGCGGGILSESLAKGLGIVTGIDASSSLIEVAKEHALKNNLHIHYEQALVENFAKKHEEQFDIITCMELLEHVPSPQSLITACAKCVRPGGLLFFSTLNRNLKSYLLAIVGAEYILGLLPKKTHTYEKFIRPSELVASLKQSGLTPQEIAGLNYKPWNQSATLSTNVSVNYLVVAKKN